jgi:putative membrane protein
LLASCLALLGVSGIRPAERKTWLLEVSPVVLGVPILLGTRRRFPLTPLAYRLLWGHSLILMLGGHYLYARVPLGRWVQNAFKLDRNPYDRLGHLAQGFVPAIVAREILLRCSPLRRDGWLALTVTSVCLSISACYEFIEWGVALAAGAEASAFLGTQGDEWDTHWDMLLALIGAIAAQSVLARRHDRELVAIAGTSSD